MLDMLGKLQEMKAKADETKKRLDGITVEGSSPGNEITIRCTANREIKAIRINDESILADKEQLEDLMIIAMNRAIEQASNVNDTEMQGIAKGMMPNFPGMG